MKVIAKESIGSLVTLGRAYSVLYETSSDFVITDNLNNEVGFSKNHFVVNDEFHFPLQFAESVYLQFYEILHGFNEGMNEPSEQARKCTELAIKLMSNEVSKDVVRSGRNGLDQVEFFQKVKTAYNEYDK